MKHCSSSWLESSIPLIDTRAFPLAGIVAAIEGPAVPTVGAP
jgi:hypothetical protein